MGVADDQEFLRFLTYPVAILCSLWILVQALESAANLDIENLYWPWYVGFTLFTATPLVIVWFIGKLSLRWRTREERKLHGGSVTSLRVKSNHVKYSEYEWIADIALSSKFLQASLPIRFPSGKHR